MNFGTISKQKVHIWGLSQGVKFASFLHHFWVLWSHQKQRFRLRHPSKVDIFSGPFDGLKKSSKITKKTFIFYFSFFYVFFVFFKNMHFAWDILQKLSPQEYQNGSKNDENVASKIHMFFSIFDTFWHIFEASEGSKCWGCLSWNCIFCIFSCFCKVGQKCFQKVQKTIKMMTKWHESWRLGGGKKKSKNAY